MWVNMSPESIRRDMYKFPLIDVKVGNETIPDSSRIKEAFVDSGTTFSYIPTHMFDQLPAMIDKWCEAGKK